ncbi:MAG: siderophore-interacting protein [Pseudomonadota bacterium]
MGDRTETLFPATDPGGLMAAIVDHLEGEHDLTFETDPDGTRSIEMDGTRLVFRPDAAGVRAEILVPQPAMLGFFKEELVGLVARFDPDAAGAARWQGETAEAGALPPNFRVLEVRESREIFDGMVRVTLTHRDVESLARGGVHLRLMLPANPGGVPVWPRMAANGVPDWPQGADKLHARFVTLRHVRPDAGEVDIDLVRHEGGLISDWARTARPGMQAGIMGPAGEAVLPERAGVFLACDGTGLPAMARLLESGGPEASGDMVLALPRGVDPASYLPRTGLRLHVLPPERFEAEVMGLARTLTGPGKTRSAFFAGEFDTAQTMRALFRGDLGLGKGLQMSVAYWRRGVPGHGS